MNQEPKMNSDDSISLQTKRSILQSPPRNFKLELEDSGHLRVNKAELVKQFSLLFGISLILIVERIVYGLIVREEMSAIEYFQDAFGLVGLRQVDDGDWITYFDGNFVFDMAALVHQNGFNLMLFTNYFITLYVGFDALLSVKILYVSYFGVFVVSFLQLIYSDARPFWESSQVVTSLCLPSYGNPSSFITQLGFTSFYTVYCYKVKNHSRSFKQLDLTMRRKVFWIQMALYTFLIIYGILLCLMALQFVINILLGAMYAAIFYLLAVTFENQISNLIKHATIMNIDSKRYVFKISFILVIFELMTILTFQNTYRFLDIDWIQNFMHCLESTNDDSLHLPSKMILGPKFTFDKTSIIFALIGAMFGVSHCFRHISTLEWYKGQTRKRILRIIVANICTIPGWIFASYISDISQNQLMHEIGITFYILESIGFLIYYFLLFGLLPLKVFSILKLNAQSSTSYVVVNLEDGSS